MTLVLDVPPGRDAWRSGAVSRGVRRGGPLLLGHVRPLLGLAATAALFAVVLPAVAGSTWSGIVATLTAVPLLTLLGLLALWAGGLALHTITLTAALPGLTARRAATLSLTGSAVANVLPVGGAAGVALNFRMARTWGFGSRAMWGYTVTTNVWDVLAKVALPVVLLPVLAVSGVAGPAILLTSAAAVMGAVVLLAAHLVLRRPAAARTVGRLLDRVDRRPAARSWEERMAELQRTIGELVRRHWRRLSVGMALYTAALLALMTACFAATGAGLPIGLVLCAFGLERLLTLAGLTPGGAGLVEVAVTGMLVSLGAGAGTAAAGILLYRGLTLALEVPVGGVWLLGWLSLGLWARRHRGAGDVTVARPAVEPEVR